MRQRVSLREHFRRGNAASIQIVALHKATPQIVTRALQRIEGSPMLTLKN